MKQLRKFEQSKIYNVSKSLHDSKSKIKAGYLLVSMGQNDPS